MNGINAPICGIAALGALTAAGVTYYKGREIWTNFPLQQVCDKVSRSYVEFKKTACLFSAAFNLVPLTARVGTCITACCFIAVLFLKQPSSFGASQLAIVIQKHYKTMAVTLIGISLLAEFCYLAVFSGINYVKLKDDNAWQEKIASLVSGYAGQCRNPDEKSFLAMTLHEIDPKNLDAVLVLAQPHISKCRVGYELSYLFKTCSQIVLDEEQRLPSVNRYLAACSSAQEELFLFGAFSQILSCNWEKIFDFANTHFEPYKGFEVALLFITIARLPLDNWDWAFSFAKKCLDKCKNKSEQTFLFNTLTAISSKYVWKTFSLAEQYLEKCRDGYEVTYFFVVFGRILREDKGEHMLSLYRYVAKCGPRCSEFFLFAALSNTLPDNWGKIFDFANTHFEPYDGYRMAFLFSVLVRFPSDNWDHVFSFAKKCLEKCEDEEEIRDLINTLFPMSTEKLEKRFLFVEKYFDKCGDATEIVSLFKALPYISPEDLGWACGILEERKYSYILLNLMAPLGRKKMELLFDLPPERLWVDLSTACRAHLHSLSKEKPTQKYAQAIINFADYFSIIYDDPLIVDALFIRALEADTSINCYQIYKQHVERCHPILFAPPVHTVGGKAVALHPQGFFKASQQYVLLRSDLPEGVTGSSWKELCAPILENPPTEEKALELTGLSWIDLQHPIHNFYIHTLLTGLSEHVSVLQGQFASIIHYYKSRPYDDILQMLAGIQFCNTGIQEGISLTYNRLPDNYKLKKKTTIGASPIEDRAQEYLTVFAQTFLNDQFSGMNALMQELTGQLVVKQGVHHGIYLKNTIGKSVGLSHDITFDRFTGVLFPELLTHTPEQALEIFYKHVTPQVLVAALQNAFAGSENTIKDEGGNTARDRLYTLLSHIPGINLRTTWEMDEDMENVLSLTEVGARDILIATGYLELSESVATATLS